MRPKRSEAALWLHHAAEEPHRAEVVPEGARKVQGEDAQVLQSLLIPCGRVSEEQHVRCRLYITMQSMTSLN